MDQLDLIDIYRTFHPKTMNFTFFSSAHRTFSKIGHILGHKSSLDKLKKIEIISSIFSDHNAVKLDVNYIKKAREFQKNIYFWFIDYAKAFDCVDHNKLWKILKEMGIPDHLTCLLRNLYTGEETTVRTGHGTTDWFQIGKGECQGCILSPCLFNLYAEYIMRNSGLEEAQAGIKIAGININNLRYADNTILMAENEELKNLLMKKKKRIS